MPSSLDVELADSSDSSEPKERSWASPSGEGPANRAGASNLRKPAPTGAAAVAVDDQPSFEEVTALAGFGPPPYDWLRSVRYAVRVLRRRSVLKALVERTQKEVEAAKRASQGAMSVVLESIIDREGEDEELVPIFQPIRDFGAQVSMRSQALADTIEQGRAERAALAAELVVKQADKEALLPELRTARVWVEDAAAAVTRAKEGLARLGRELTAAHEEATKAAGDSDFAPPEHARRITELEERRRATSEEVRGAEHELAARRAKLSDVERRISVAERAIADVHARRAAADRQALANQKAGERELKAADHDRLDACETALRRVVKAHSPKLTPDEHERFLAESDAIAEGVRRVLLHQQALDSYDPDAMRRGIIVVTAALGGVLAILIVLARALS